MPNHYVGDLLHTMGMSGLSRVRTELVPLAIVQPLTPHPVQMHRQLPSHRDLRDLPSSSQGEVEECAAPLGMTAHRDLRRFHQQKPEQHVALLADVSQSAPIAAGVFLGHQPDVAGDLFAAVKTFGRSDHQLIGQCRQRADSRMRHQPSRHRSPLHLLFQVARQILYLRRQLIQ
jgi:hypothetical protein